MAEDFVRSLIREGDRTAPAPLGHGGRAASTLGAWAAARQTWMLNTQADLDYYVEAHPSPEKPMLDARAGAASLPAAAPEGGDQTRAAAAGGDRAEEPGTHCGTAGRP